MIFLSTLLINRKKDYLIIKFIMKKTIVSSVIALTVALVGAASVNAAYNANLSVGSTGADVSALQAFLISKGFDIKAVSSKAVAPGYFGSQTKSAVSAYQASVGLPSTGFVGPLTRGVLNGTSATVSTTACPVGFTCTANPGTVVTPVTPTALVMDGTDGSLTASLSSYASNVTIKKGETKDLVAVKLQATAAPVSVTRFDVRFNTRPWLYFSTITLKDSNGTVVATKALSSAADATEITVGSDYLVRFEGINAVVTPGTDRTMVVSGTVLSTTDKLSSDVSVIVSVPNGSIRTLNGKGYTDSIGLGTVAVSGTTGRTATLSSSGSTGNILVKIAPNSPSTGIQTTSTSGETSNVVLGRYDFKSENRASTINTLTFTLKDNGRNRAFSTMFKRLYIVDGATKYNVDSVATSSVFSNLTIDLPQDSWKTITLMADVADQDDFVNGAIASTTITVNTTNIVGVDSNYTTVTASGANTVTSSDLTFLSNGASVTGIVSPVVVTPVDNGNSAVVKKTFAFTFKFNNTGTNDLYVSKDGNIALGTTTTFAATTTQPWANTVVSEAVVSGDTSTMYVIPAGGSRTFTYQSTIDTTRDNTTKTGTVKISSVYFTDLTNIATPRTYSITYGLESLTTPLVAF